MAYRIVIYNERMEAFHGKKEYRTKKEAEKALEESLQEETYIDDSMVTGGEVEEI